MAELYRYAAFISYSSKDAKFAQRLHRALESYGIPSSLGKFDLIGGGKKNRIYPVFRDREELSAGQLGDQIEANLKASAALIVVCSPNGAASPWVQKEIEFFAGQGRHAKIFAIISDSAPLVDDTGADSTPSCFPAAFRGDALTGDKLEPLAADARKGKDGFRNAWLKIVAGMVGVSPGQIVDRDKKRRKQRRSVLTAALACAMSVVVYGVAWIDALAWRTSAAFEAQSLAEAGRVLDATPLALAATAPQGAIVFPNGAQVEAAYRLLPAVKFDLGSLQQLPDFSPDGKWLSGLKTNNTWFVMSMETGEKFDVALGDEPLFSDDGTSLIGLTVDGHGLSFDLASKKYTSLGQLACAPTSVLGGAKVFLKLADGRSFLMDPLGNSIEVPAPSGCNIIKSPGGAFVAISQMNSLAPTILDTRTGGWRVWTELEGWPEFSGNDAWLVDVRPSGTRAVFNVESGEKSDILGERELDVGGHIFSSGGASLAWRRLQTWFVAELSHGLVHELGRNLREPPQFSEDGSKIAALQADQSVVIIDVKSGARTELGPVWYSGTAWALQFSSDGSRVAFRNPSGAGTVLDLANGHRQPFDGSLPYLRFSPDGSWLIARGMDEQYFLQNLESRETQSLGMTRWATFTPDGRSLLLMDDFDDAYLQDLAAFQQPSEPVKERATKLCERENANFQIRAFGPEFRLLTAKAAGADEMTTRNAAISSQLRGRPWNACDWRGLGSIFPDPQTGDGWFEGARQWWRLFAVRNLGEDDYACGETLSNASLALKTMRSVSCSLNSHDETAPTSDR